MRSASLAIKFVNFANSDDPAAYEHIINPAQI